MGGTHPLYTTTAIYSNYVPKCGSSCTSSASSFAPFPTVMGIQPLDPRVGGAPSPPAVNGLGVRLGCRRGPSRTQSFPSGPRSLRSFPAMQGPVTYVPPSRRLLARSGAGLSLQSPTCALVLALDSPVCPLLPLHGSRVLPGCASFSMPLTPGSSCWDLH